MIPVAAVNWGAANAHAFAAMRDLLAVGCTYLAIALSMWVAMLVIAALLER
jgi:hypothetical protein